MNKLADFWINQTLIEHETFESNSTFTIFIPSTYEQGLTVQGLGFY